MPEYFETQKDRITFAEKMEYRFKQVEAARKVDKNSKAL